VPAALPEGIDRVMEELRQQTRQQLQTLHEQREEANRELDELHQQIREAHHQLLRETQDSSERVRQGAESTQAQLAEVKRLFQQAGQQFVSEFEKHLGLAREQVEEARRLWEPLPRQARHLQQQLAELLGQIPEARRQLQEVEQASSAARQELATVQKETVAAEARLDSVTTEFQETERRLQQIRQELERVTEEVEEARQQAQEATMVAEVLAAAATLAAGEDNRLGVVVDPGVVVAEVLPDTPAQVAGLVRGDVIRSINDTPIFSGPGLRDVIHKIPDGQEMTVYVIRNGATLELRAQLELAPAGEAPLPEGRNRLGVVVDPGVVVARVLSDTPAAAAGLVEGDVIRGVNDTPVHTSEQLLQAIQQLGGSGGGV
jgi:C-terminal processing protease CtpA/Prc